MLTPANLVPGDPAGVAAAEALGAELGVAAATDDAATVGAAALGVTVAAPQPAITTTRLIAAATDLNRDTASSSS